MKIAKKIGQILNRKHDYSTTKCLFNSLYMDGGSDCFDGKWLKEHMPLIKEIFLKTPNVEIWCNYGKARHNYGGVCIEDMLFENENLILKIKSGNKSMINFEFEKPSEGCITIDKGIGSRYALYLYSKENSPSQIILSYHNI